MHKSDLFFLLLVASIPIQLGKYFFLEHSYVLGIAIDYRAATIYLSDLFLISYVAFFLHENGRRLKQVVSERREYFLAATALNSYLFLQSILFSTSQIASLFFNLKVLGFSLLPLFAVQTLKSEKIFKNAHKILLLSVVLESFLVVGQFLNQGSLGLTFLGERTLDATTPQIAHSTLFGNQFLRPYGTFPHPNVAAAYIALSAIILLPYLKNQIIKPLKKAFLVFFLVPTALLVAFSKSAFAVVAIGALFAAQKTQQFIILLSCVLFFVVGITTVAINSQIASISERILLIKSALEIANKAPLFGVGSNNFILELSKQDLTSLAQTRLLQPVHNVFLLLLAENGLVGLLVFTSVLLVVSRFAEGKIKTIVFLSILFYFSVDHFMWTLQQGQLIFWFVVAFLMVEKTYTKKVAR